VDLKSDPFIQDFPKRQQTLLLSAFAHEIRTGVHSKRNKTTLVSKTVRSAVDDISKTFRDHDKADPRKDRDGVTSRVLQQQYQSYTNKDPSEKQQKAIPLSVIRTLHKIAATPLEQAIAQLDTGAIYFAMRSCEYNKVPDQKDKRTKILCIKNFRFFKDNVEQHHSSPSLSNADCVSITFEFQKNNEKNETVTQERTSDPIMCPVKAWAATVQRVLSYPKTTSNTPINIFMLKSKLYQITSKDNINLLRSAVKSMNEENLGFTANEIGTHSIRSGGAMAMKLSGAEDSTIRLIGRWKSDSFLKYIRKQIQQFSSNISRRMLGQEHFTHIPSFDSNSSPSKLRMAPSPRKQSNKKQNLSLTQSKDGEDHI
jgi:hypothetical protein